MNHKQHVYKNKQSKAVCIEKAVWVIYYRPDKVSQPWSILGTYDNKLSAIIKANQVSGDYFMVKVTDPDGSIAWSN